MRFLIIITVFVLSLFTNTLYSQVRVEGGVTIDIDLPIPKDIVIVSRVPNEEPAPKPFPKKRKRHNASYSYGEIQNQNGPVGRQVYTVINAQLGDAGNGVEVVSYKLNTGDLLELFISTANPNDYNYHAHSNHNNNHQNNVIHKVLLNGQFLELRDGSLSLQPKEQYGFHSVINLHSTYEGDFNGTVNF